ncbi:MAG: Rrf2 family transcriptional regulator [bacterium]|nr:Rrf2 family transcriptional regulator [bacterium]
MSYLGSISAREHSGLRLASWLAKTYKTKQPVALSEISHSEAISLKYLEQLILPFRQAGWVKSTRGRNGGYVMAVPPRSVTVKAVLDRLSDQARVVDCLTEPCDFEKRCPSQQTWKKVQQAIDDTLERITLSEISHT